MDQLVKLGTQVSSIGQFHFDCPAFLRHSQFLLSVSVYGQIREITGSRDTSIRLVGATDGCRESAHG